MDGKTVDAVVIETDGTARWVEVPVDCGGNTLEGLQSLVKGLIECVSLGDGLDLWANEEGLIKAASGVEGFGPNVGATLLAVEANEGWSLIVGPCVVTGCGDEGETVSLPRVVGDGIVARSALGWPAVVPV